MQWQHREIHKVHCLGIGGIGVSGLARLLMCHGVAVSGSDMKASEITGALQKEGVRFFEGHQATNLSQDVDIVIMTAAIPAENPELQEAERRSLPILIYPEALHWFMGNFATRIAVAGTNGKSTTTAMIAEVFEQVGRDPTALVGSLLPAWGGQNARCGKSEIAIFESCEWRGHMLLQDPTTIVLTNLEEEHLDYYRDLAHILEEFEKFIAHLPAGGIFVVNADRTELMGLKYPENTQRITYGFSPMADVRVEDVQQQEGVQILTIVTSTDRRRCRLKIPGRYNVENALAACATAIAHHVPLEGVITALENYRGLWRRFEIKGRVNGALIVSDYAHHPDAIEKLLAGAKAFYPQKNITIIFQPHQHRRTKDLFAEFVNSFHGADRVVITDIYDVAGRENPEDQTIHASDLAAAIQESGQRSSYMPYVTLEEFVRTSAKDDDVFLLVGAGDIYLLADHLVGEI